MTADQLYKLWQSITFYKFYFPYLQLRELVLYSVIAEAVSFRPPVVSKHLIGHPASALSATRILLIEKLYTGSSVHIFHVHYKLSRYFLNDTKTNIGGLIFSFPNPGDLAYYFKVCTLTSVACNMQRQFDML